MANRSFFIRLGAIVVGLLLLGAIGWFWLFSPAALLTGRIATPAAAMFIPRQAPLVLSLLVNPNQLPFPATRGRSHADLQQLLPDYLEKFGFDYKQEIQPWLGEEVTLAVTTLDVDRQFGNGQQPGYLLALAVKDAQRSREALSQFWQRQALAGKTLLTETFQGVKLTASQNSQPDVVKSSSSLSRKQTRQRQQKSKAPLPPVATAMVSDRFVLVANDAKVLRSAINNVQAVDLGLANADFYQQALDSLQQQRIGLVFVNLPELARWQLQPAGMNSQIASDSTLSPSLTQTKPTYDRLAVAIGLARQGLVMETAAIAAPGVDLKPTEAKLSQPVQSLQYLPASTMLAVAGSDLAQTWPQLIQGLEGYRVLSSLIQQPLQAAGDRWQLDLPTEVFAWVTGEYSLGLVPTVTDQRLTPKGTAQKSSADWLFVVKNTDAEQVSQGIQHLDEKARQQGFSTGSLKVQEQPVVAWTKLVMDGNTPKVQPLSPQLAAKVVGTHTDREDYTLLTSSLGVLDQVLPGSSSLLASDNFKQATAPLDTPNNGYLYLNWKGLRPWLEDRFPLVQTLEALASPYLDQLQSLSLSSYGTQEGIQRSRIYLRFS